MIFKFYTELYFQEKKPWGQLAPKFSSLVASKSISVMES